MRAAILQNGQLIYASEVISRQLTNERFYCIKCNKPVILKQSKKGLYFFSHLSACGSDLEKVIPIESDEHKQAKKLLMRELSQLAHVNVIEEKYFSAIQQTADTFVKVNGERPFIYEYQRSVISTEEVSKRQTNYLQIVDQVHWLLDYQLTVNLPLNSSWLQTMLNYSEVLGYYLCFIDLSAELIVVKANLPLIFPKNVYEYTELKYRIIDHACFKEAINVQTQVEKTGRMKQSVNYQRELRAIMANDTYREELFLLYEEGILISQQPAWIVTEQWQFLLIDSPSWLVLLWIIVILKEFKLEFTPEAFVQALKKQKRIQLNPFPLIKIDLYYHLAEVIIQLLIDKGLVQRLSSGLLKSSYWADNSSYDTL